MSSEIEQLLAYERVCRGRSPSGFFGDTWYFGVHEHGLRMFSYIRCVHPIQDYDTECRNHHRTYCVCLFWQIGREVLILTEEFTTLITSIGPPPGSGLGEVSSSLPPAPPLIKRQH